MVAGDNTADVRGGGAAPGAGADRAARHRELGTLALSGGETDFALRCDALACDRDKRILLLSAAGPETSVKALAAVLRSEAKVRFYPELESPFYRYYGPVRHPAGYTVQRAKLDPNTWHVLCTAKVEGLLPVLSEEALWQELRGERFTTPLLRSWVPWLLQRLLEQGGLVRLEQVGCEAGLLLAGTETVDELVSEGINQGHLRFTN
jgi:hypothetical protein